MGTVRRTGVLIGMLALVAVAAVAVACGGGDEEPGAGSPTPGATETPSAVEEQLNGMVLQLSDLPAGFSVAQESYSTNQDVAGGGEDAVATLARLTEWGRILGHAVVFSSQTSDEAGVFLVDSTVSLYQSDGGAAASFADALTTARTTDWQATMVEADNVNVEEIPVLDVADEMLWLRITGTASVGEPVAEKAFTQDVVLMRIGRVRGSVSILSSAADVAPLVEDMVRAQAANMAAGIQ